MSDKLKNKLYNTHINNRSGAEDLNKKGLILISKKRELTKITKSKIDHILSCKEIDNNGSEFDYKKKIDSLMQYCDSESDRYESEAMGCFTKASELDPTYAKARKNLGNSVFHLALKKKKQGEIKEAEFLFNKALSNYKSSINHNFNHNSKARRGIANCHFELGDYEKAIEIAKKSIEEDKDVLRAYFLISKSYSKLKNYPKSLEYLEKAQELAVEKQYATAKSNINHNINVLKKIIASVEQECLDFKEF